MVDQLIHLALDCFSRSCGTVLVFCLSSKGYTVVSDHRPPDDHNNCADSCYGYFGENALAGWLGIADGPEAVSDQVLRFTSI